MNDLFGVRLHYIIGGPNQRDSPRAHLYTMTYQELPYLDTRMLFTLSMRVIIRKDEVIMRQKCSILPNYFTDNNSKCARYFVCSLQGRTKDPQCPAKGQK